MAVIPNTVDLEYYSQTKNLFDRNIERQKLGLDPFLSVLLFCGRMNYPPNIDAVKFILDELAPRLEKSGKNSRILVVGTDMPGEWARLHNPLVSFYNNVPDIRRFLAIADSIGGPVVSWSFRLGQIFFI